ncbi:uncharacterized protein LOC129608525 isoform X2 [Condylostylus longicornis]|nr:uncharacterized protein LOC129608525 isoform X2 [Condylostylus longicornis]XP_055376058.1 uncharacterized protein LOC129608525 isoform X2 [Condylostylus longicornis]
MVKSVYLLASVSIISALVLTANALKCWRCSSDATNGAFCSDPFDPEIITDQQKYWSYVNCTYPYNFNQQSANVIRPVCKKLVQEIYGKVVVSRSCFYEDISEAPEKCYLDNFPSYVRTIYCQTCPTDGCNTAPSVESSPIFALMLIPIAIAKILLF